jgi:hypothetical protein
MRKANGSYRPVLFVALLVQIALALPAAAQLSAPPVADDRLTGGKLLATGGVTQFEGAGGGGLTPWALITGYGTNTQIGANGHVTHIGNGNFQITSYGAALGLYDRFEFSVARQDFQTDNIGQDLRLGPNFKIKQDIVGVKAKLVGDAVLDQDRWLPQIAIGAQFKNNNRSMLIRTIGGGNDNGVDLYISATKVFLAQSVLVNGTLRFTKGHQTGLLGFGDSYKPMLEGSAALFLSRHWLVGAEYRMKPNTLAIAKEDDWADLFVSWVPNKTVSLTAAYLHLGNVITRDNQKALYVSLQVGF